MKTKTNRPFIMDKINKKVDIGNNTIQNIIIVILTVAFFTVSFIVGGY